MTTGIFRNLVLARAMAVEPIARALCADPLDARATANRRMSRGWSSAARRADQLAPTGAAHEAAGEADEADLR